MQEIKIDDEFRALIPPLSDEEFQQLEANILAEKRIRDPLVVWRKIEAKRCQECFEGFSASDPNDLVHCSNCDHHYPASKETCGNCHKELRGKSDMVAMDMTPVLLDGHNRYDISKKHGIEFAVTEIKFFTRDEAEDWIDSNQLGRRNLSADQSSLIRGRRYNRAKKKHGGDRKSSPHNEDLKTAERLAATHGVSKATIERDGQFAKAVEKIKSVDPDIEKKVTKGTAPPKAGVLKAAELLEKSPEKAAAILEGKTTTSQVVRDIRREETIKNLESVAAKEAKAVAGVFDVVVIDPPWPMEKIERDVRPNQTAFDYPTMQETDLAKLKIPCADDCHVWVWTTHRFLPMALRLLSDWGLKYVCTFVWHKPGGFQPVGLPQFNCEFAIYARRGSPKFIDTKALPVCFEAARGKHSEKPDGFYDVVRRVTGGRRLDMFNRREIDGFDRWGNEAD